MKTRVEMLEEMGVSADDAKQYIADLEDLLPQYGIADSRERLAHFFSQVLHESGCMRFRTSACTAAASVSFSASSVCASIHRASTTV